VHGCGFVHLMVGDLIACHDRIQQRAESAHVLCVVVSPLPIAV
jgi:hypothetical protein